MQNLFFLIFLFIFILETPIYLVNLILDNEKENYYINRVKKILDEILPMNSITDVYDATGQTNLIAIRCEDMSEILNVEYVLAEPIVTNLDEFGLESNEIIIPENATHYRFNGLWERYSYRNVGNSPKQIVAPCNPKCTIEFSVQGYEPSDKYREIEKPISTKQKTTKKKLYNNGKEQHYYIEGEQPEDYVLGKL